MKNWVFQPLWVTLGLNAFAGLVLADLWIPNTNLQSKILATITQEMARMDGEGATLRLGRGQPFSVINARLLDQISDNQTPLDFYRSFSRQSAAYPNLHSYPVFQEGLEDQFWNPLHSLPNLWLKTESDGIHPSIIRVSEVTGPVETVPPEIKILPGAELVAVNELPVRGWLEENFEFCKWPLRAQCDLKFESQLHAMLLDWKGGPLTYTLKQNNSLVRVKVQFSDDNSSTPKIDKRRCHRRWQERFPGARLVHQGLFACLFEMERDPTVAILRISSFKYRAREIPENEPIRTLDEEINAFRLIWHARAGHYRTLVVDVIDNGGGSAPTPYYRLLLRQPFQEHYVRFKKTPEMEDATLRRSQFWESEEHELWFQKLVRTGEWEALPLGAFTSPVPQFCPTPHTSCDEGLFQPEEHSFRGNILVLMNENCVSSCDGFVWNLKRKANATLFGFHPAADTAFSRMRIDAVLDSSSPDGFRTEIHPFDAPLPPNFIVGQVIATSLSTDEHGTSISGSPLVPDHIIPYRWNEWYPSAVFQVIKNQLGL